MQTLLFLSGQAHNLIAFQPNQQSECSAILAVEESLRHPMQLSELTPNRFCPARPSPSRPVGRKPFTVSNLADRLSLQVGGSVSLNRSRGLISRARYSRVPEGDSLSLGPFGNESNHGLNSLAVPVANTLRAPFMAALPPTSSANPEGREARLGRA